MAQDNVCDDGMKMYTLMRQPFEVYGVNHDEQGFFRVDREIAASVSEEVDVLSRNTSGGRIRFRTNSARMKVIVKYQCLIRMRNMPLSGSCGLSVVDVSDGGWNLKAVLFPDMKSEHGYEKIVDLCGEMREYIIWLPLYNDVTELTIGLDADAVVEKGSEYDFGGKPIVYYGSSITQGGCASRPDNAYQALISKRTNTNFINLGFSGNAKGETAMAEYSAKLNPLIFVMDYDHNAENTEKLEKTHYAFYRAFRKNNADTPVVFISRPDFEFDSESDKRRSVIKKTYEKAKAAGDDVYFIDGESLFGGEDRVNCTVDRCHPNDLGLYRMSIVIGGVIERILDDMRKKQSCGNID